MKSLVVLIALLLIATIKEAFGQQNDPLVLESTHPEVEELSDDPVLSLFRDPSVVSVYSANSTVLDTLYDGGYNVQNTHRAEFLNEACVTGICPDTFYLMQDVIYEKNLYGECGIVSVTIPAGTPLGFTEGYSFFFPFNQDNYCACLYEVTIPLDQPCVSGGDTIYDVTYTARIVEMHYHLLDSAWCQYQDTVKMKAGGPHVDISYPDEKYIGHPELVAKSQSFYFDNYGEEQFEELCFPQFELVRPITSPRGCVPDLLDLVDANPAFFGDLINISDNVRNLSIDQLFQLNEEREGVVADGVSEVLLKLDFTEKGRVEMLRDDGSIELPWSDTTYFHEGKHYVFALYTPPDHFDPSGSTYMHNEEVEAYDQELLFDFITEEKRVSVAQSFPVARPPVVLVHGTYSDPEKAWKTPADGEQSLFDLLTSEGFKVYTVDYTGSNGNSDPSGFEENALVVGNNDGGIQDAINSFRTELGLAATQVDIVGHSLGGVLPRVYASEYYNADYKIPENFMEGDINRLITIASTHFGSHLGELQVFLEDASVFDLGSLGWIANQARGFITDWMAGTPASEAVRDQLPPPRGEALENIGTAEIPVHAITCAVDKGNLKDLQFDPNEEYFDLYWYIALLMYNNDGIRDAYLDYKLELAGMGLNAQTTLDGTRPNDIFPGYDNAIWFKEMIEDGIETSGKLMAVMDSTYKPPTQIDLFRYGLAGIGMADYGDPILDLFEPGADPVGVAASYVLPKPEPPSAEGLIATLTSTNEHNMEALRSLIFNNDKNDGVVRVESQSGELELQCEDCVTHFENVLHGFAPRYPQIQQRIIELLKAGDEDFHEEGFPEVDHAQKIYYPSAALPLMKVPTSGGTAICRSGMVPSHAEAFAEVADAENAIILVRPVNPDATALIRRGAATKEMNIKPKSSNWGPQKGYLPVDQRYSKIWKVFTGDERKNKIAEYTQKAIKNIVVDQIAVERHLSIDICNREYIVYIYKNNYSGPDDQNAEDEIWLVPASNPTVFCYWNDGIAPGVITEQCSPITSTDTLIPFTVLATERVFESDGVTPRYLTADYDLLMVGFYEGMDQGPPNPPNVPFKEGVGQITPRQEALLEKLNNAVNSQGYDGGAVSHHGPENQFSQSPYIDYPVTVFTPDAIPNGWFSGSTGGKILSIEMGPPGFRDINLKMFINQMREAGYDLYDNRQAPGWRWVWNVSAEGYEMEDSEALGDYVEQVFIPGCEAKSGTPVTADCNDTPPVEASSDRPESWLGGLAPNSSTTNSITVYPNPIDYGYLSIRITAPASTILEYRICNAFGEVVERQKVEVQQGMAQAQLDASILPQGVYTVTLLPSGTSARFIKL